MPWSTRSVGAGTVVGAAVVGGAVVVAIDVGGGDATVVGAGSSPEHAAASSAHAAISETKRRDTVGDGTHSPGVRVRVRGPNSAQMADRVRWAVRSPALAMWGHSCEL